MSERAPVPGLQESLPETETDILQNPSPRDVVDMYHVGWVSGRALTSPAFSVSS